MVTITSKFSVGDTVYTIDTTAMKVKKFVVDHIGTTTDSEKTSVYLYEKDSYSGVSEDRCFVSEKQLMTYVTTP